MGHKHFKDEMQVLGITSLAEFGERYCYYLIQGLLIFLLTEHFAIPQMQSDALAGTVLSVIYISAIVGGYVSDRILGYYLAALLGGLLMIAGNLILVMANSKNLLFLGLTGVSLSSGLIKSNMSSFIGRFYDQAQLAESNRDFGFNIFYVGINAGASLALLSASWLKDHYGFQIPFYSNVVVAVIVLIDLILGSIILKKYLQQVTIDIKKILHVLTCFILYIAIVLTIFQYPIIATIAVYIAAIAAIAILVISAQNKYWNNIIIAMIFFTFSILYWALYFQMYISILLFIKVAVNHQFLGIHISDSQLVGIENIGVLAFGWFMGKLWLYRGKIGKPVHDIDKFNLGFILLVVIFMIMYMATAYGNLHTQVRSVAFVIGFALMAISDLSLSAIGLSFVTKIAPKGFVSLYMGIWLVTLGIGGKVAGLLSQYITISHDVYTSRVNMAHGFMLFTALALVGGVGCFLLRKIILKLYIRLPQK